MRIIAGKVKGHALVAPKSKSVRPTSDRVREALFSIIGADIEGMRVLDLYAGVGAIGIEALSRGAVRSTLVEQGRSALKALRRNLDHTRMVDHAEVLGLPVWEAIAKLGAGERAYDLIFLDPPYKIRAADLEGVMEALLTKGLLASDGRIVLEHSSSRPPVEIEGLAAVSQRVYGDTALTFYRLTRE